MLQHALFRADVTSEIGFGHVMRCLALAQHMADEGVCCHLLTTTPDAAAAWWRCERLFVHNMGMMKRGSSEDERSCVSVARQLAASASNDECVFIVDGYEFDLNFLSMLRANTFKLAMFDDLADRPIAADWIINQNPGAEDRYDYSFVPNATFLLGARYVVLRNGIRGKIATGGGGLLVTLGGADRENLGFKVVQELLEKGADFPIHLVYSAPRPGFDAAVALAGEFDHVRVSPVGNIERLMIKADAALCAGGVTSLELSHLGVPSVVMILADNQRPGALALGKAGAAVATDTFHTAVDAALGLMHNGKQRRDMSNAGRQLIDGEGASRILHELTCGT